MMIGIIYNKRAKRWLARVGTEHIGSFMTEAEAIAAQAANDPLGNRHIKRDRPRPFCTSVFSLTASNSVFTMADFKRTRASR
jgi:hypothetical protein